MDMSASSQEAMAYEEAAEAGEMQLHTTFMFVITASCSLVLIFYFMSGGILHWPACARPSKAHGPGLRLIVLRCWTAMSVLISVLFSFISSLALGALVYPYVDRYTDHRFSREIDVPYLGPIPILVFVLAPACIVCVGTWLLTKR